MKNLDEIIKLESKLKDELFRNKCNNFLRKSGKLDKLRLELLRGKTLKETSKIVKECKEFSKEFAVAIDDRGLIFAIEDIAYHGISKAGNSDIFMIESNSSKFNQTKNGFHKIANRRFVNSGIFNPYSERNDEYPKFDRVLTDETFM